MISSSLSFPPVSWWVVAVRQQSVVFDLAEHYQKHGCRNRYYLASPQGKLIQSVPLEGGRNQRIPAGEVRIADTDWQSIHWKTITSLYRRSPYFEHLEHLVYPLFRDKYVLLHDWNLAGVQLINNILNLGIQFAETKVFRKDYGEQRIDLRNYKPDRGGNDSWYGVVYHQVFAERSVFLPDCSILDLLFCEGIYCKTILEQV